MTNPNSHQLAHPGIRFQGQFIDGLISYVVGILAFILIDSIASRNFAVYVGIGFGLAYFLFSDGMSKGQSIGKKLLKLQVLNKSTLQPCSYFESFLRNVTFPLGIFDWIFILTKSSRRFGDYLASTIVIRM